MLKRNPEDHVRETKRDIRKVHRDFSAELHPFEAAREYQKALNAAKLERVFAKPFLGALSGHSDGVSALRPHPKRLSLVASTSYDGEVRLWNLVSRKCVANFQGHKRYVPNIRFIMLVDLRLLNFVNITGRLVISMRSKLTADGFPTLQPRMCIRHDKSTNIWWVKA